jgi:hypothetical protein
MTSVVHVEPGVELPGEAPNASDGNKEVFDSWIAQVKSREGEMMRACHSFLNQIGIANTHGLTNSITTTKYSLISWLPKSLWEQFRRIANVYFLVISILMV